MKGMAIASRDVRTLKDNAACGGAREDARLVAALRNGADGAFALLVADYQTAVYNLAWRLVRDREDARDISQEVFLKALQQIPRTNGELRLWAWLYRVTVNACWDHARAVRRRPILADRPLEEADHPVGDGEGQAELSWVFLASLAQLPVRQQAALLLKDVHGLRHSDIAAALGISRGSSEVLLFRARRSFRSAFTAMTVDIERGPACHFAEQVAAYSVGGHLTEARSRRVLEHADSCPDCHRTVERWTGVRAVGLGLALPLIAAPELLVAQAATSASASTMVTAGASSVLAGLTTKLAGIGVAKAAVVALAATVVVTGGGATVYKDHAKEGGLRTRVPIVSAAVSPGPAAMGVVADALAAPRRTPVTGDRPDHPSPDARQSPVARAARANGLFGRFGFDSAARRVKSSAGRLRALGPRLATLPASVRRSGSGDPGRETSIRTSTLAARKLAARRARFGLASGEQAAPVAGQTPKPERSSAGLAPRQARSVRPAQEASRLSRAERRSHGAVRQPGASSRADRPRD